MAITPYERALSLMAGAHTALYEGAAEIDGKLKQMELERELTKLRTIAVQRAVLSCAEAARFPVLTSYEGCLCTRSKIEGLLKDLELYPTRFEEPITKEKASTFLSEIGNWLFTLLEEKVEMSSRDLSFFLPHLSISQRYALENENLFRPLYVHYSALRSINTEYDEEGVELEEIQKALLTKKTLDVIKEDFSLRVKEIVLDGAKQKKYEHLKEQQQIRNRLDKVKVDKEILFQKKDCSFFSFYDSYPAQRLAFIVRAPSPLALSVCTLLPGQLPLTLDARAYASSWPFQIQDKIMEVYLAQALGLGAVQATSYHYGLGALSVQYSFYLYEESEGKREIPFFLAHKDMESISSESIIDLPCTSILHGIEEIDLKPLCKRKIVALREEVKERVAPALKEWQRVWDTIVAIAADYFGEALPAVYPFMNLDPDKEFFCKAI
jgi:hypothetical protein